MEGGDVTVLCMKVDGLRTDRILLELHDPQALLVSTTDDSLADELAAARDRGAVVVIGARERHEALLELGADEVAAPDADASELRATLSRARARAQWRATTRDVESPELGGLALMGAAMSHHIRNSLASAVINCSNLEALVGRITSNTEVHETIHEINNALWNIKDLVNEMLSVIREDVPGVCDMSNTLLELTAYVHKEIGRVADFEAEIPSDPCPVGLARVRVLEVIAALLNNATLAVEQVATRAARITLRLSTGEDMIVVEVADNGIGMTPEVRKKALNPFFTTRRPGALGMGLTFAAMTVRRAGGEILIDSEFDVGTSVRLFLPRLMNVQPQPIGRLN